MLHKVNQDGRLFTGPPEARLLVHNIIALQQQEFHLVGHVIALSLLYGGGAPHFFSDSVVAYLLDEDIEVDAVNEVADEAVSYSLRKVYLLLILWVPTLMA